MDGRCDRSLMSAPPLPPCRRHKQMPARLCTRAPCALALVMALSVPAQAHAANPARSAAEVPEASRYVHLMASAAIGDSLRFNNPFRLAHQLGDQPESLSRTPFYGHLGAAVAFGDPNGWQPGVGLNWSRALAGLPQHVLTPSLLVVHGGVRPWVPYARAGLPIVLNPDANVGAELALGGAFMITAGIGVQAELAGSLFYGAATWDTGATTIPMLSAQAGIVLDYELLP